MSEEKVFFQQSDVMVTNARFVVSGQTYAMNAVSSVRQWTNKPSLFSPIVLTVLGGVLMLLGGAGAANTSDPSGCFPVIGLGLLLAGCGAYWLWSSLKTAHWVLLTTSGGEVKALSNTDKEFINNVIHALNEAIVYRG